MHTKYIHAIAEPNPYLTSEKIVVLISFIISLVSFVNISIMVYTLFTKIMGLIIGKVIFQKFSHAVAPYILDASYKEGEMD